MKLWINVSSSDLDRINDQEVPAETDARGSIRIAMVIVGILSVSGTIGNALVLLAFFQQKQKLTSTVFILTLATTDFISSFITMPYTIVMEFLEYRVQYDVICKLYHFIVTTTIPFSAFVMVAIAVDRYLGIVHPFKHTLTLKRAKVTVVLLACVASVSGLLCCLAYGVSTDDSHETGVTANISSLVRSVNATLESRPSNTYWNISLEDIRSAVYKQQTGYCHKDEKIMGGSFFAIYKKMYSSFYAICAVIVITLYGIIYHSLLTRRRQRLHVSKRRSKTWMLKSSNGDTASSSQQSGEGGDTKTSNDCSDTPNRVKHPHSETKFSKKCISRRSTRNLDPLLRSGSLSHATLERMRIANIKTALMLSLVALTYIVAFLPAWLMAHHIVPMNVVIFYLYFTYNVSNPVIYAFLNQNFRHHLRTMINCGVRNR